jgi:hypothetical protein
MNLVKAADDIKNLSDQQLLAAGQNPVAVPPYLVLAEMKRREQLRASYAKAQQQQEQPPVAQQVAQNLAQGMQQGPPQQQGIMQGAPPQAAAMAAGGHVARYAQGDLITDIQNFKKRYEGAVRSPDELQQTVDGMVGSTDFSPYEEAIAQQMQSAQGRKPRIGDALIAAGAAIAGNRDPRVGLASLLAQGIGVGTQSYRADKERQEKDINAAMLAKMSLEKMRQQERDKKAEAVMQLMRMDSGQLQTLTNTLEANARSLYEVAAQERNTDKRMDMEAKARKAEEDFRLAMQANELKARAAEGDKDRSIQRAQISASQARSSGAGRDTVGASVDDLRENNKGILEEMKFLSERLKMADSREVPAINAKIEALSSMLGRNRDVIGAILAGRMNPGGGGIPVIPRISMQGEKK